MAVSQRAAIAVTQFTLFMRSGLSMRSVALAAGTIADTIKIQQSTKSAQPAKNPAVFPKIILTHEYEVPAFAEILLRLINANVIPNIIIPHTKIVAGESRPAVATSVEVVISILYAGAVPAIHMTMDSQIPRVQAARPPVVHGFFIKMRRKE